MADERHEDDRSNAGALLVALMPGVLVFVALYVHVLMLLAAGLLLAGTYARGPRRARRVAIASLLVGLCAGVAIWHPLGPRQIW